MLSQVSPSPEMGDPSSGGGTSSDRTAPTKARMDQKQKMKEQGRSMRTCALTVSEGIPSMETDMDSMISSNSMDSSLELNASENRKLM